MIAKCVGFPGLWIHGPARLIGGVSSITEAPATIVFVNVERGMIVVLHIWLPTLACEIEGYVLVRIE